MPQFSRPTIVAAVRTMDRWIGSNINSFLLDYGLEHVVGQGSAETRANLLIGHLLANLDATTNGENLVDAVVRDLVERAAGVAWRRSEDFAERYPKLATALARDGFIVQEAKLRRALPDSVALPAADDEVHELLKRFSFTIPMGHLDQAIDNHADGKWASANGQLRSFMEGLLDEMAERIAPDPSTLPLSGHGRRTWLAATASPPFLLSQLNEWNGDGKGYFEGFFKRLHPQGSHPGLSDEDDCTFRLHTALIAARLLLRRLAARLGV